MSRAEGRRVALGERGRWALSVAAGALLLAAANLWWVARFRHGYPLNIDEAGYTSFGLSDTFALGERGLSGWWEAIQGQPVFAPLVPAITSIVLQVKLGTVEGFVTLTGFGVLLVLAAYGVAERLAGPRFGALAALLVATSAGAFRFSREYIYALPTAALLACAVYALLRSDGLSRRRWALACGAALGLMLLARTMSIAFVPGVLAAGLLSLALHSRGDLRRRLANLALLIAAGVAVAATWYARNIGSVVDYLTGYGYGSQSKYFGAHHALVSWGRARDLIDRSIGEDLLLPLALLLAAGILAIAVVALRRVVASPDRRATLRRLLRGDVASVAIVIAAGYAALATSRNGGVGFSLPVAMLLPPLAVVGLRFVPRQAVVPAVAVAALIAIAGLISNSGLWDGAARSRTIAVPGLGSLPYLSGVPGPVGAIRQQVPGPETQFTESDRRWPRSDLAVAERLLRWAGPFGEPPVTVVASHSRVLNTNTIQLASLLYLHRAVPFVQLRAEPDDSPQTYLTQLRDPVIADPTVFIDMSSTAGDFTPRVSRRYADAAARRLGFRRVESLPLPDGRMLRFWHREAGSGQ